MDPPTPGPPHQVIAAKKTDVTRQGRPSAGISQVLPSLETSCVQNNCTEILTGATLVISMV